MAGCSLCGGTEFFLEDGFYYCSQCQTQKEDTREEVHDYFQGNSQRTETKKVKEKKEETKEKSSQEELTTWEMYNIILRGFVDQMIALGATNDLKIVVLQLWVAYLSRIEVAFHKQKTIKFNLGYKKRDIELLSGKNFDVFARKGRNHKILKIRTKDKKMKKGTKKKKNRKLPTQLTRLKRTLIEAESSQSKSLDKNFIETSQLQSQSQTLENLTQKTEQRAILDRFVVSKHTQMFTNALKSHLDISKSKRTQLLKLMTDNYGASAHNLSLSKLIGILQLGMILSHQEAQIGDTLRWMAEGHLSHEDVKRFFDPGTKISFVRGIILNKKMTHSTIRISLRRIADILSIESIPAPNFYKLTARYCLELQLPDELLQKVHELLVLYPPKEKFSAVFSFEARAMSYIIVVLKLFLGFDDVTERALSDMADFLNRKYENEERYDKKYFSWTEWVKFIECRRTVVSHYHYSTRLLATKGHYSQRDTSTFFPYWQKRHASDHQKTGNNQTLFGENMKHILDHLNVIDSTDMNDFEFPASLTPLVTYTNELLCNHSDKLDPATCSILRQSFPTSVLPSSKMLSKLKKYTNVEQNSSLRSTQKIPLIMSVSVPSVFKNVPVNTLLVEENLSHSKSAKHL